jgi:hypothetical protein
MLTIPNEKKSIEYKKECEYYYVCYNHGACKACPDNSPKPKTIEQKLQAIEYKLDQLIRNQK